MTAGYPDPARRLLITTAVMLAGTMTALDTTIINVALPHMQSTMSASQEQTVWALTSYLIATAIATPLSSWLADRFGRRQVMILSVAGFTLASLLCGIANDIGTLVLARTLQGISGAALVPLSQATLLDIYPPEGHAKAMAIYGLGSLLGPLIAPALGGWLTDTLSWRWVFFINLPFGLISFLLMIAFLTEHRVERPPRFDMFGFATVSLALASFQLLIDRGDHLDWFESTEIWIYAAILAVSVYLTIVHMMTAKDTFIRADLFRDRNFAVGNLMGMTVGVMTFATIPIIVVMMQTLLGYSALRTGLVGAPRGIGTLISMLLVTRLVGKVETRLLLVAGLAVSAVGQFMYAGLDLYTDQQTLLVAGLFQGLGMGFLFVPLSLVVFATLPATYRNEGAALYALTRNLASSLGISLLAREVSHATVAAHAQLVQGIRPDSPVLQHARPDFDFASSATLVAMNGEINRQAAMVGNIHAFWLVCLLSLAILPLIALIKTSKRPADSTPLPAVE